MDFPLVHGCLIQGGERASTSLLDDIGVLDPYEEQPLAE